MSLLQLVIFDCDGVMFDSKEANLYYYNHLLNHFNHPDMDEEELEYVHIHHVIDSVNHIFRHYPRDIDRAHEYRLQADYTPFLKYMKIEPDLVEFLDYLRPAHHLAISTNRTTTMNTILEIFKIKHYFAKVVTAQDVVHPKPHPEALHQILSHFNMDAAKAIYIGDSIIDRDHSAGAGIKLIAFKQPGLEADYHVNSFMEICNLPCFR